MKILKVSTKLKVYKGFKGSTKELLSIVVITREG